VSRVPYEAVVMDSRVARTHTAVMDAATELLLEGGPNAVTIDGVVTRSGVAKSTVYRHWATRDELLADVFGHVAPELELGDPSLGFEDAVRDLVRRMVRMLSDPHWQRALPALMLLKLHQHDIAAIDQRMQDAQLGVCLDVLRRGVDEGRIRADDDQQLLLTLLIGPLMMASLTGSTELNDVFADRLATHFLTAVAPLSVP
jgi:AcrR family transcriptional regulator